MQKTLATAERRKRHIERLQKKLADKRDEIEFLNAKAATLSNHLSEAQAQLAETSEELSRTRESMLDAANGSTFPVRPFTVVEDSKEQALKPLEEAAEAFGAWQLLQTAETVSETVAEDARRRVVEECADVIQAAVNLAAAMGVNDMTAAMRACHRRNHERGRC